MALMPDTSGTTINGTTLTALGLNQTGPITVGAPSPMTSLTYVPGDNGSFDATLRDLSGRAYFDRRQVTVPVAAVGTRAQVASAKVALGSYLGRQVDLYDARNGGTWRGPLTISEWTDYQEAWDMQFASTATLTVSAEPGMILPLETVSLSSGYNSVTVKGNMLVWPKFTLNVSGSPSTVGVTFQRFVDTVLTIYGVIVAPTTGVTIQNPVYVDCYRSLMTMGSNNARLPISLTCDPSYLLPGFNRIGVGSDVTGTMTYYPRVML